MNPESGAAEQGLVRSGGQRGCLSVSELNQSVARTLERVFPLVMVGGEVSNFTRAASGHWYFTLKDEAAQVRCAMFRGRSQYADFVPREGDAVEVRAQVRLYEARGEYQLVVDAIRRAGQGSLLEAFNRLKEALAREGLFDAERKRPLPAFVRTIGVVTSPDAAALRDVATTLAARAPHVRAIVYPAPVQGEGAAAKIAAAIGLANARRDVDGLDVLIVCRGGGSIEDLWAFNEEIVARAIAASALPVISGVGHETDITIADFVADVRAATPTAAAQAAVRARDEWLAQLDGLATHLRRAAARRWEHAAMRLDAALGRLVSPAQRLEMMGARLTALDWRMRSSTARRLDAAAARLAVLARATRAPELSASRRRVAELDVRIKAAVQAQIDVATARVQRLTSVLDAVSPRATLRRGYAIVERGEHALTSVAGVQAGERVAIRLIDGALDARVEQVRAQGAGMDE